MHERDGRRTGEHLGVAGAHALAGVGRQARCARIALAAHDGGQRAARVLVFSNVLHGRTALSSEEPRARILPRIAPERDCGPNRRQRVEFARNRT